uniref:Uncharacterized protein n=1 Tax=Strongyloides papillosus TaxID=174720 RepID=A0A0N5C894_STREA
MINAELSLKIFILLCTCGIFINCQPIFNPYAIKYSGYIRHPSIISSNIIPVTVPGHNGRTPFINNGFGFITQSAALLNGNNVVIPPRRVVAIPSYISPFPNF